MAGAVAPSGLSAVLSAARPEVSGAVALYPGR